MRLGAGFPAATVGGDMTEKPESLVAAEDQFVAASKAFHQLKDKGKDTKTRAAYLEAKARLVAERTAWRESR